MWINIWEANERTWVFEFVSFIYNATQKRVSLITSRMRTPCCVELSPRKIQWSLRPQCQCLLSIDSTDRWSSVRSFWNFWKMRKKVAQKTSSSFDWFTFLRIIPQLLESMFVEQYPCGLETSATKRNISIFGEQQQSVRFGQSTYGNAAIVASFTYKSFLFSFRLNICGGKSLYFLQKSSGWSRYSCRNDTKSPFVPVMSTGILLSAKYLI